MKTRLSHEARATRTLFLHELREQVPLGLLLLAAGVAILFSVRFAAGVPPGDVGAHLPFVVPALAALLLAFPAADLLGRDAGSGLARTLAAAPVGRARLMVPRLVVFLLIVTIVIAALLALEPPRWAFNLHTTELSFVALTALLVCVALSGAVLSSAIAALITGAVLCCGSLAGLTLVSRWSSQEADLTAAAQVFAEAFIGSLSVAMLLPSGLLALFIARALRGACARLWTRRLRSASAAALVFIAPPALSAAFATYSTIDVAFDDPRARLVVGVSEAPGCVIVRVFASDGPWSSTWEVDVDTAERRRFRQWLARARQSRLLGSHWLAESPRRDGGVERGRLRFDDGTVSELLRVRCRSFPSFGAPFDRLVYISDVPTLHIVSLIDGKSRQLQDLEGLESVRGLNLSPDGRWLALSEHFRPEPGGDWSTNRVRLVDTRSGAVVRTLDYATFRAWRSGPAPMVATTRCKDGNGRESREFVLAGPNGTTSFPIELWTSWLEELPDGRFVCRTQDGRVLLLGADGTTERTLRSPRTAPTR